MKSKWVVGLIFTFMAFLPVAARAAEPAPDEQRMNHIRTIIQERQERKTTAELDGSKQTKVESESSGRLGMRMLEGLFLCLGLFFIGVYAYRKKTGMAPIKRNGRLKIVDRIMIAQKTSLVLAEVDGREVLIAVGSEQVSFFSGTTRNEGSTELELVCGETDSLPVAMHS